MPNPVTQRNSTPVAKHLLLNAYACDPVNGSEPGVGWQVLKAALRVCDSVTILTRANNMSEIAAALDADELRRCRVVGHDLPWPLTRVKRRVPLGTQAYYLLWQLSARRVVARLHNETPFDVAHHATFAIDWMPTAVDDLARRIPVVWGPVGGSTRPPLALLRGLGPHGVLFEATRWASNRLGTALAGRQRIADYALCVAQNDDVLAWIDNRARATACEPNAFITLDTLPRRDQCEVDDGMLIGVGRLIPWKGWALAISALRHLPDNIRLELLGAGPDEARLRRHAKRLGLDDRVVFRGRMTRDQTLSHMARARAMVFPSLHDSASTAMGEALSIGCPRVALPLGGSSSMIRRSGGILVDLRADVPREIATGVLNPVAPRHRDAWDAGRLTTLLAEWYGNAMRTEPSPAT
jgi:glycosyltransferase involved in cell wall biosynthesis